MAARVVTRTESLTLAETFAKGDRVAQSNKALDERLNKKGERFGWTRSGTLTIYLNPGEKFGPTATFLGYRFEVPKRHQGLKDAALALEHPGATITMSNFGLYVVNGRVKAVVEEFPAESGWYLTDEKTAIPQGRELSTGHDPNARYLWRVQIRGSQGNAYIGSVVRGYGWDRRLVDLDDEPADRFGVELENRAKPAVRQAGSVAITPSVANVDVEKAAKKAARNADSLEAFAESMTGVLDPKQLKVVKTAAADLRSLERTMGN